MYFIHNTSNLITIFPHEMSHLKCCVNSCRCWFQFAGVVPNIPVELDITNRSDVLHQVDRAKVSGQSQAPREQDSYLYLATFISFTSRVPVEGKSSVCVICMKYRIIFYYHQPVSSSIIVYCKHLTPARTNGRRHAYPCARTRANACTHPTHIQTAVAVSLFDASQP